MRRVRPGSEASPAHPSGRCGMCASALPSETGGTYQCQTCHLCEGCVQARVVSRCPGLANGAHLHRHPLTRVYRRGEVCRVCDGAWASGSTFWTCAACDFYACGVCMAQPPPAADPPPDSEDESDPGGDPGGIDEERDGDASPFSRPFDAEAAERIVAARWPVEPPADEGVAGAGAPAGGRGDGGRGQGRRGRGRPLARPSVAMRLPGEAMAALRLLKAERRGGGRAVVAAADLTHAEDLLHRGAAVEDGLPVHALYRAVAAGRLEIAGTLLLSRHLAPGPRAVEQSGGGGGDAGDDAGEACCCCGDAIDAATAPDGAVGCLNGHAMHAACAADLLLGGGGCPICRQPLYFPQVGAPEATAALELAKAERAQEKARLRQRICGRRRRGRGRWGHRRGLPRRRGVRGGAGGGHDQRRMARRYGP